MIEVSGLAKYYGDHKAIDQISFKISEGEIVGLLGLNGAGKSTILKILGCFLMPSQGDAKIAGYSIEDDPQSIRGLIGFLPDTPPLYDEMTVGAYLDYVARLKDVPGHEVAARVHEAMEKANLIEVKDAVVGTLSHGYRQRVGIAQAIVHKPKVLILDEPINGLDPVQIVEMRDLILSFRGQHTVILSSHILSEITQTCDRILIVDEGKLIAEGREAELQQKMSAATGRLQVELDDWSAALEAALRKVHGVAAIKVVRQDKHTGSVIEIESEQDVRAQVAKVIVGQGVGLLGMSRQGGGLENLFMRFVRS